MIVLTADCGLALGEHGYVGPASPHTHEETTHVPLILCLPAADEAGRRVAALTQAADLAPTLADVFEVELPSAHGRTLLPLVYGEAEELHPYVCSGAQVGDAAEWSLRTLEWAFLLPMGPPRPPRLYVKPDDPLGSERRAATSSGAGGGIGARRCAALWRRRAGRGRWSRRRCRRWIGRRGRRKGSKNELSRVLDKMIQRGLPIKQRRRLV